MDRTYETNEAYGFHERRTMINARRPSVEAQAVEIAMEKKPVIGSSRQRPKWRCFSGATSAALVCFATSVNAGRVRRDARA